MRRQAVLTRERTLAAEIDQYASATLEVRFVHEGDAIPRAVNYRLESRRRLAISRRLHHILADVGRSAEETAVSSK